MNWIRITLRSIIFSVLAAVGITGQLAAQDASASTTASETTADAAVVINERWTGYTYEEVMVPMRDGIKLRTHILKPRDAKGPLPIIFSRSPYGWVLPKDHPLGQGDLFGVWGIQTPLIEERYIFIVQDERGRFGSEGEYELLRPFRSQQEGGGVDGSTDSFDTIEWALANIKGNNGRVGLTGTSYRGWHAMVGLIDPHPAVKAAAPSAAMSEGFLGDDFYHHGALQLAFGMQFVTRAIDNYTKEEVPGNPLANRPMGIDGYDFFLKVGTLKGLEPYFPKHRPSTEAILENDTFNEFYQSRALREYLRRPVTVPTMHVAHWYDGEDNRGPLEFYHVMEAHDTNDKNMIVAGPWYHGAWRYEAAEAFGPLSFGSATGTYFTEEVWGPFFRHHLKGGAAPALPEALLFDTGTNEWRRFDEWPVKGSKTVRLYLHADGAAGLKKKPSEKGQSETGYDAYISDPETPVPYYPRPNLGGWQRDFMVQDQRFALQRPDVLVYSTPPLKKDLKLCGRATAKLFASTEGTDTDWVVKLIDEYPNDYRDPELLGFQRMIHGQIFRAKFRKSFSEPEPVMPGAVEPYTIDLLERCHTVRKGHRLVVHVQSTWFPLFDRNPNTFMTIADAEKEDFRAVENRIYRNTTYPSHLELTVIP